MEESQWRNRVSTVGFCIFPAVFTIPLNLVEVYVVISAYPLYLWIRMWIEYIKNLSILASVRRFQGENKIGNTRNAFGSSGQVVRDALNNLKQFFTSQTLLIVMITKSNGKGNFTFGNQIQYSAHSLFGRLSINHITRKNHQIGFLGIKHFIDSFDRNIRPRIIINVMHICKLHDFELPIGIELQCLGIAGTYKPQQQA